MTLDRLNELIARFPSLRIAVLGDFFLDKYLITDPTLSEVSIETGLEARQVVEVRRSPGAAGTVTNNLSALGVGQIFAIGAVGVDGEADDLVRGLHETRVSTDHLLRSDAVFTPTYLKTMVQENGSERELERLDTKNRQPMPAKIEEEVLDELQGALLNRRPHALIVLDQVQERNHGVVTDRIRAAVNQLAVRSVDKVIYADSRTRIGEFTGGVIKPNYAEACFALGRQEVSSPSLSDLSQMAMDLADANHAKVFLTCGPKGMICAADGAWEHIPTGEVSGPIDIVGAGDSATAGIVAGLCAGATPSEAAELGNLCASVTIRKLGTTGTANPDELREMANQTVV